MNYDIDFIIKLTVMLDRLKIRGIKEAIVAGGAVRDMLLEKPIADIDVFYTGDFKQAPEGVNDIWFNVKKCSYPEYVNSGFNVTHEGLYKDIPNIPIQLIKVEENPADYITGSFDADICLCYINEYGVCLSPSFLLAVKNKDLGVTPLAHNQKHLNKLIAKYPDFNYGEKVAW